MIAVSRSPRGLWWLMTGLAAGYCLAFVIFPGLFPFFGIEHFGVWFLDTFALLASNDAVARGLDPYVPNPLDYFGRLHVYSHWWLGLHWLGIGRKDVFWLGFVQVGLFFVAAVRGLRPRTLGEMGWYLVVLCSSSVLLILNRANNDLVVFLLLLPVVPCLLDERRLVRMFPVFLIAVATGLKFYPATAGLVLLAGADIREVRARIVLAVLLLIMVGAGLIPDLVRLGAVVPRADGLMTFGFVNLLALPGLAGALAPLSLAVVAIVAFWWTPLCRDWEVPAEQQKDWLKFVLAAVMLTGCYLSNTNYAYRWIFALWMAPFLWNSMRSAATPLRVRKFARGTSVFLVLMLWLDPLLGMILTFLRARVPGPTLRSWADLAFKLEQPVTFAFFVCLLGWLACFIRERVPPLFRRT